MNPRKDPLESYLDSSGRLNFSNFPNNEEEPANEVPTQALMNSIKHITSTLISFGFPPLGNLLSSDHPEVQKTITCIYALLQQRQKDLNFRSEVSDRVRALESEKNKLQSQVERTHDSKLALEAELGKLQNSVKSLNLKTKAEKDKLLAERDELKRENIKLANKESQCLHELKKKDALYGKLQEQLRKTLGEKDLPVRNSIEIVGPLHTSGPALFGKNGDSEFSFMISRGFEENQNALLLENKELRSSLDLLQSELLDMLQQRKEAFQKRYQEEFLNEAPDLNEFKMNPIKKDLFNLPYSGLSEEVVKTFQENMRVYQRFMDKIDEINAGEEGDAEMERIKCVGDLKELLKNYRILLKNQENLMQNSVLGSKAKAPDAVGLNASRLRVISDNEIDKANRYLQDEFKKLEAKQQEIEEHRAFVNETAHRMDEEKILVSQREHLLDERARWELALQTACKLNKEIIDE